MWQQCFSDDSNYVIGEKVSLGDKYIYHRMKVPVQVHLKCFFSEELERDRCILFHHLNIRLFLDDLTCFKMMHSFQHFFILQITGWDITLVSKNSRGKTVSLLVTGRRVVQRIEHCRSQLLHSSRFVGTANPAMEKSVSWFDWLMSLPDRPCAVGPTCFRWQALLLRVHQ